jgi:hypothetical protein
MRRLLDILLALDTEYLRAVSAIWIERDGRGGWQARLSIARDKYDAPDAGIAGVAMMIWERVPDQCYPLNLDEIERDADVLGQAREVQQSGLIGRLDMARYDAIDRSTSYLIKSHAGTQAERTTWLLGLRERPENMIYGSSVEEG